MLDGHQGVHGLAGLADGDDERALVGDRVAVTELVGEGDLDGDAGPVLDGVLGDHAGVGGGAARHDDDPVDVAQLVLGDRHVVEHQAAVDVGAAEQGVADRVRLVVDLLLHERRVAALLGGRGVPGDLVRLALAPGVPSKLMTVQESGVIVTIWSWPSSSAWRVWPMNAATSEPRKFSPSPRPTTSGLLRRAPTTTPGLSACTARRVNAPSSRLHDVPHRLGQVAGRGVLTADELGGHLGVGLARERRRRRPGGSFLRAWKFSMMPLWMRASRPSSPPRCGWAFWSVGPPWVAQRVCPIPVVDAGQRVAVEGVLEVDELAGPLLEARRPSVTRATPAESYPRYSRRARPSMTTSSAMPSVRPTYPTIPHMRASLVAAAPAPRVRASGPGRVAAGRKRDAVVGNDARRVSGTRSDAGCRRPTSTSTAGPGRACGRTTR